MLKTPSMIRFERIGTLVAAQALDSLAFGGGLYG
jgi:hypothetical protein